VCGVLGTIIVHLSMYIGSLRLGMLAQSVLEDIASSARKRSCPYSPSCLEEASSETAFPAYGVLGNLTSARSLRSFHSAWFLDRVEV
jgi:hypothetical protein